MPCPISADSIPFHLISYEYIHTYIIHAYSTYICILNYGIQFRVGRPSMSSDRPERVVAREVEDAKGHYSTDGGHNNQAANSQMKWAVGLSDDTPIGDADESESTRLDRNLGGEAKTRTRAKYTRFLPRPPSGAKEEVRRG